MPYFAIITKESRPKELKRRDRLLAKGGVDLALSGLN